jgi:hypothetical protein
LTSLDAGLLVSPPAGFEIGYVPIVTRQQKDLLSTSLPISLYSFDAVAKNKVTQLNWTSFAEFQNDAFDIERSSDGMNWTKVGQVRGAGTTSDSQHYDFIDDEPFSGLNYYRLKQIDFSGRFEYSFIKSVFHVDVKITDVYPNSNTGKFNLIGSNLNGSWVDIIDGTGRRVQSFAYTGSEIDISDLPTGLYIVLIEGVSTGERIVKK